MKNLLMRLGNAYGQNAELCKKAAEHIKQLKKNAKVVDINHEEKLNDIRRALARYLYSEGCGCCENYEAHNEAMNDLGQLLDLPPYEDGSGYNYREFLEEKRGH